MGLAKLKTKISAEEYLESEKLSPIRREYLFGEMYPLADSNDNHNRIVGNVAAYLSTHLRDSRYENFVRDMKVRVSPHVYYYPDILVSCEENPENPYFRNEPILIVEVLSPSTENIDRREKLLFY